ncbi:MAG: hypothetical protein WCD86_18035 [Ktedonobacteraceae bacterium]
MIHQLRDRTAQQKANTMPLPARRPPSAGTLTQQPIQPDYRELRTLADLAGLRLVIVYRLSRGQRVRESGAWERYLGALLVLQQRGARR